MPASGESNKHQVLWPNSCITAEFDFLFFCLKTIAYLALLKIVPACYNHSLFPSVTVEGFFPEALTRVKDERPF